MSVLISLSVTTISTHSTLTSDRHHIPVGVTWLCSNVVILHLHHIFHTEYRTLSELS